MTAGCTPRGVELESRPCPLGCPTADEPMLTGRDELYGLPGRFAVVRCRACGLLRTDPRPTPATIGAYYPEDYPPFLATRPRPLRRRSWRSRLAAAFELNVSRVPPLPPGRMLEIGCAAGGFLDLMRRRGWEVEGLEPAVSAAAWGRAAGHTVHVGRLEDAPDPAGRFDLVVGWMVLEHLHDPVAALRRLWRWTRPGAWLALSTPDAAALELRLFRQHWFALHLPNHLYHFTPRTITAVLARGGFGVERVLHQRVVSNLVGSLGLRLAARGRLTRLADALRRFPDTAWRAHFALFPLAAVLAAAGQTGRMTVWARRSDVPPA